MVTQACRRGGFPPNVFCNQVKSESYHCLVCLEVCRSPVTCKSGAHLFCLDCLTESIRRKPTCPVCREPLTAPLPSAFASAQVSALDVVCIHDKCKWKGTCGRLDGHLDNECAYEPVTCPAEGCGVLVPRGEMATHQQFVCLQNCPNSKPKAEGSDGGEQDTCQVRLSRNDLIDHLKYHCKLRLTHCPNASCEVSTASNRMPAHLEVCPYSPVSCPLQCGAPALTRQSLDTHKRDCPKEPVPCIHAPLGCSHVAPRDQMAQHERDIGVHFLVLSKAFVQLQQSYEKLQQSHVQQITLMQQMFEKKLQVHTLLFEQLQAQVRTFGEDLHYLQPAVVKAKAEAEAEAARLRVKAEAEAAKARAVAEGMADDIISTLRCYKCSKQAEFFYKNDLEPQRNDSCHIHRFSGTCSSFWHLNSSQWGTALHGKSQLVEAILKG